MEVAEVRLTLPDGTTYTADNIPMDGLDVGWFGTVMPETAGPIECTLWDSSGNQLPIELNGSELSLTIPIFPVATG